MASRREGPVSFDSDNSAEEGDVDMEISDNIFKGGNGHTYVGSGNSAKSDNIATIRNNTITDTAGDVDLAANNKVGRCLNMDYQENSFQGIRGGLRMGAGNTAGRDRRSRVHGNKYNG